MYISNYEYDHICLFSITYCTYCENIEYKLTLITFTEITCSTYKQNSNVLCVHLHTKGYIHTHFNIFYAIHFIIIGYIHTYTYMYIIVYLVYTLHVSIYTTHKIYLSHLHTFTQSCESCKNAHMNARQNGSIIYMLVILSCVDT